MTSEYISVARRGDLDSGDIVPVSAGGIDMILYRVGDDYYAAQRRCVHQGADLAEGVVARGFVVCGHHGWRFHAETGVHEVSPETCLAMYRVRVVGDDIQINPTPIRHGKAPQ